MQDHRITLLSNIFEFARRKLNLDNYSWGIAPVVSRAFLLDVSVVEATISVLVVGGETAYYLKS
jgi:hypothetical protein